MTPAAAHAPSPRNADDLAPPLAYEDAKRLAMHADAAVRRALAGRGDVRPELLYYLAEDRSAEVRRAIAANPRTPAQADLVLARDADHGVRSDLAGKIAALIPGLDAEEHSSIYALTVRTLRILATDTVTQVRGILAETLKEVAEVPADVIQQLASDIELSVAAPVLEFSPLLSDDDLTRIIESGPIRGALKAIARRRGVSARVASALFATADEAAVAALLGNDTAQIREDTLDRILDAAPRVQSWHEPLVRRPALPPQAVTRLAGFVAERLLATLLSRTDLDAATAATVRETVQRRLADGPEAEPEPDDETPLDRALRLRRTGRLTDEALEEALATGGTPFVIAALSLRAQVPINVIERIVAARTAKGMLSLAWRAGLPATLAMQIQLRLGRVPPQEVIPPRDGARYALSEADMLAQIKFFMKLEDRTRRS